MYAIALTSIPPRLSGLGPVLETLLAQRPAPARVMLCLPWRWSRFPGPAPLPALPGGVDILRTEADHGPATKAVVAARALRGEVERLIYCDDDWLMPQGWAARLLAGARPGEAAAATGFGVARLKRRSHVQGGDDGRADIAQGYSGVAVDPAWLSHDACIPPAEVRAVDDIWLSGQLALQGIDIRLVPGARAGMVPAMTDAHALQSSVIGGRDRHAANLACCDLLTGRHGLWPPL